MTIDLYRIGRPILFSLDAERAHDLTLRGAAFVARHPRLTGAAAALYAPEPGERTAMELFGLRFPSPVGLAAGLDKNGVAIDFWAALGFGFVEVGTVTPGHGQPGNDKPRLERIVEDKAVVNRMGFNNLGAAHLAARLSERRTAIPIGANLGKAKTTPLEDAAGDYEETLSAVFGHADYIVINVSSPNTPGLRDLQAVTSLEPLLVRVLEKNAVLAREQDARPRPMLVKIAPDLADDDVDAVADMAVRIGLDGIVATNTTLRHELLSRAPSIQGGVSGAPLAPRALELVRRLRRRAPELPIVGVGGITTPEDAYERIRAGASLVQVYTGLIYEGPGLARSIVEGLRRLIERDGLESIQDAVGKDA